MDKNYKTKAALQEELSVARDDIVGLQKKVEAHDAERRRWAAEYDGLFVNWENLKKEKAPEREMDDLIKSCQQLERDRDEAIAAYKNSEAGYSEMWKKQRCASDRADAAAAELRKLKHLFGYKATVDYDEIKKAEAQRADAADKASLRCLIQTSAQSVELRKLNDERDGARREIAHYEMSNRSKWGTREIKRLRGKIKEMEIWAKEKKEQCNLAYKKHGDLKEELELQGRTIKHQKIVIEEQTERADKQMRRANKMHDNANALLEENNELREEIKVVERNHEDVKLNHSALASEVKKLRREIYFLSNTDDRPLLEIIHDQEEKIYDLESKAYVEEKKSRCAYSVLSSMGLWYRHGEWRLRPV